MAEDIKNTSTETTVEVHEESLTPTVEELMAQLTESQAREKKTKLELDKALKETGNVKKALRARQTAEEQEAEAKAEAQRIRDEEFESMKRELNHNKAVNAYKAISSEETIESLIEAVSESDHNAIAQIIENEKKQAVKIAEAEWLKSRPQIGGNAYSGMTIDQIMAIADRSERLKAIANNKNLF